MRRGKPTLETRGCRFRDQLAYKSRASCKLDSELEPNPSALFLDSLTLLQSQPCLTPRASLNQNLRNRESSPVGTKSNLAAGMGGLLTRPELRSAQGLLGRGIHNQRSPSYSGGPTPHTRPAKALDHQLPVLKPSAYRTTSCGHHLVAECTSRETLSGNLNQPGCTPDCLTPPLLTTQRSASWSFSIPIPGRELP